MSLGGVEIGRREKGRGVVIESGPGGTKESEDGWGKESGKLVRTHFEEVGDAGLGEVDVGVGGIFGLEMVSRE